MLQKKLEANSVLFSQLYKKEKKFSLTQNLLDFKVMKNYIPNFFKLLWGNPKLVADIIINCDKEDVKDSLANLFTNNFYQNILSSNYNGNFLIYVVTLLMKEEINNLNNVDDFELFLGDNSKVGYFMDELRNKTEVKCFFKTSILNLISELESKSSINFSLDIDAIINKLSKKTENNKCLKRDSIIGFKGEQNDKPIYLEESAESSIFLYDKKISEQINKKIGFKKLKLKYLRTLADSHLKEKMLESRNTNPDMSAYLANIISKSTRENSYSIFELLTKFALKRDLSEKILTHYIVNFYLITDFIDKLISIIKKNLFFLPYHIKCFCKIIAMLLEKKFPNINNPQKIAFISQFFFKKILKPILANPRMELFINNFIISGFTIPNLNIIIEILNKLFSGELFEDNDDVHNNNFTPFNWYFLEKMPEIMEIFKKLTEIELPPFTDDLINDTINPNFSYDYFKENKDEEIMHYFICFTPRELKVILNSFSNLIDKLDITKYKDGDYMLKTFEKLNTEKNRNELELLAKNNNNIISNANIKKNEKEKEKEFNKGKSLILIREKDKEKENNNEKDLTEVNTDNYYLIQNFIYNDKYSSLFKLKIRTKQNFFIKEIKDNKNPENSAKNILIKIKNFLSDLLYNITPLNNSDFSQCNISDTYEILNSIKHHNELYDYILDDSIPLNWYVKCILNLLKNIPEDYAKNDFEKLYNEFEEDIKESMNKFNVDLFYEVMTRLKYFKKEAKYYEEILKILKDLELNEKIKHIVENDFIPVKIVFNYDHKNMSFDIKKLKIKKEEFQKKESKEIKQLKQQNTDCFSIKSFIEAFPDFSAFEKEEDFDILEMQNNLSLPQKMKEYFFSMIQEHLTEELKNQKDKVDDLTQIIYKIYDYVMSKLNPKIFPKIYYEDDKIYSKLLTLYWIKPRHFIEGKNNFIFDAFLPEAIEKFQSLENEPSPRKKILNLASIFDLITKIIQFNGGNTTLGVDDQMPILNYFFIKVQPKNICSNMKFIQLYRNSLNNKGNESQLLQLTALIEFIKTLDYNKLIGITKEEFEKNCNEINNEG